MASYSVNGTISQGSRFRGEHTSLRPAVDADLDLLALWFSDPDVYLW
jgi:hypothetical protein